LQPIALLPCVIGEKHGTRRAAQGKNNLCGRERKEICIRCNQMTRCTVFPVKSKNEDNNKRRR